MLPLPQFTLESLGGITKAYDRVAEGKVRFRRIMTHATCRSMAFIDASIEKTASPSKRFAFQALLADRYALSLSSADSRACSGRGSQTVMKGAVSVSP